MPIDITQAKSAGYMEVSRSGFCQPATSVVSPADKTSRKALSPQHLPDKAFDAHFAVVYGWERRLLSPAGRDILCLLRTIAGARAYTTPLTTEDLVREARDVRRTAIVAAIAELKKEKFIDGQREGMKGMVYFLLDRIPKELPICLDCSKPVVRLGNSGLCRSCENADAFKAKVEHMIRELEKELKRLPTDFEVSQKMGDQNQIRKIGEVRQAMRGKA